MLTLPETIATIRALDTPDDIKRQAMTKVLAELSFKAAKDKDQKHREAVEVAVLAREFVIEGMAKAKDSANALIALATALGALAAEVAGPGQEAGIMDKLSGEFVNVFLKFREEKLIKMRDENPIKAVEYLIGLMESAAIMSERNQDP